MAAGRKRTFDEANALLQAVAVFAEKGYSGTSLSDLTAAMNINKPSLYAAFGNKEDLFVRALHQYVESRCGAHAEKLEAPGASLQQRLTDYLKSVAAALTNQAQSAGCFIASSTCESSNDSLPSTALDAICAINKNTLETMTGFFAAEQEKGNIEKSETPANLADHLLTIQFGLAVMAKNGAKTERLDKVIDRAISGFGGFG